MTEIPVASPPTTRGGLHISDDLPTNFAYENFALNTIREHRPFKHQLHLSLLGPAINFSLLQTPMFRFIWSHCALSRQTLVRQLPTGREWPGFQRLRGPCRCGSNPIPNKRHLFPTEAGGICTLCTSGPRAGQSQEVPSSETGAMGRPAVPWCNGEHSGL